LLPHVANLPYNFIFLIGMPACGKSTIGRHLASALNYNFIDSDQAIAQSANCSIEQIFDKHGQAYFRQLEAKFIDNLTHLKGQWVIATGGGLPCFHNLIKSINRLGISIYLHANPQLLLERIQRQQQRAIFAHRPPTLTQLEELLKQREKIYAQAKMQILTEDTEIEQITERILTFLSKHS